jgi:hypothetical protein
MSEPGKALRLAAGAAREAYTAARASHSREELAVTTAMGADGTPTMLIDAIRHRSHPPLERSRRGDPRDRRGTGGARQERRAAPAQPRACRAVTAGAAPY